MPHFQDTFETRKRSFISAFTICMTVSFSIFRHLGPFSQVFARVKEWNILKQHEIIRVSHLVACPMFFNLLCHHSRQTRACSNYVRSLILSIFRRLGRFPDVFEQVKEWLIIELQKIIRLSHIVACPIVFLLGGVFKVMKMIIFQYF